MLPLGRWRQAELASRMVVPPPGKASCSAIKSLSKPLHSSLKLCSSFGVLFLLHQGAFHAALANRARAPFSTGCHCKACGHIFKITGGIKIASRVKTPFVA